MLSNKKSIRDFISLLRKFALDRGPVGLRALKTIASTILDKLNKLDRTDFDIEDQIFLEESNKTLLILNLDESKVNALSKEQVGEIKKDLREIIHRGQGMLAGRTWL